MSSVRPLEFEKQAGEISRNAPIHHTAAFDIAHGHLRHADMLRDGLLRKPEAFAPFSKLGRIFAVKHNERYNARTCLQTLRAQNFAMTMIGRDGAHFFVNSADSRGRKKVDEMFAGIADMRGAVPWALVVRENGVDAVPGRVAIRERFRELYGQAAGGAIGTERARQLLRGYPYDEWCGVSTTRQNSLHAWARDRASERERGIAARTGTDVTGGTSAANQLQALAD